MERKYWAKRNWYLRNHKAVLRCARQSQLGGKWRGLHKRPYTGHCELCGETIDSRLHYHHWDDEEPSLGLWLCAQCHRYAEGFDNVGDTKSLFELYISIKQVATRSYYNGRLC